MLTNRTAIPQEISAWYDQILLYRAIPLFIHTRWAQVRDIPRNAGTSTIKFRRYANLTAQTTPLTEGVTPVGEALSTTEVLATVKQYGNYVTITDVVDYESKDPVLMESAEILGDNMADTIDQLTRDVLSAGLNVYYAGTATSRATVTATDLIDDSVVRKVVRLLKNNKTKRITRIVNATTGIATEPLNASYVGLVHPNTTFDLKNVTGFLPIEKYSAKTDMMEGEIGKIDEVRFVESTNCKVFDGAGASGIDVYSTIIFGMDAYGTTRISTEAMKMIVKPLGSGGSSDPLDQRATSGWKATFVAMILNQDFLVRIEHATSA